MQLYKLRVTAKCCIKFLYEITYIPHTIVQRLTYLFYNFHLSYMDFVSVN